MPKTLILTSHFKPAGDQPIAIKALFQGVQSGLAYQTLLGVTGSGKTFSIAHVIQKIQRPVLILAPNKTLAAQLYGEMRNFFRTMQWNILFRIMIIINLKPMFPPPIPI